jgi:hypothetical protein
MYQMLSMSFQTGMLDHTVSPPVKRRIVYQSSVRNGIPQIFLSEPPMTTLINCVVYHPRVALPVAYLAEILFAADHDAVRAIVLLTLRLGRVALRVHGRRYFRPA